MEKQNPDYTLTATLNPPKFEASRKYIMTEKEYAGRQIAKLPKKSWLFFSYPALGIFRREDWQQYKHLLEKYEDELEKHALEIENGLLPLKFNVENRQSRSDTDIKMVIRAVNGRFLEKKKPPKRPTRIDGTPDAEYSIKLPKLTGFSRRGISISEKRITVEFSKLEAHDNARLISQVIYLECSEDTHLTFELSSSNVGKLIGNIELAK